MGHPRPQFRAKADLPVGFPYRFNSSCISVNVRGLNSDEKRIKIYEWLKDISIDIIFLQETHFIEKYQFKYDARWPGESYHCYSDSTHSRGVFILFRKDIPIEVLSVHRSNDGRKLLLNVKHEDNILSIVNIYAPNNESDRINFFKRLQSFINNYSMNVENIIICGDFNCVLSKERDKSSACLKKLVKNVNLCDVWFDKHKELSGFTWCDGSDTPKSRIDYVFVTDNFIYETDKIIIRRIPGTHAGGCRLSDHRALKFSFILSKNKRGSGYWKLNTSFLENDDYVRGVKGVIEEIKLFENMSGKDKWESLKYKVKQFSMGFAKRYHSNMRKKITEIENEICSIEDSPSENIDMIRKRELENELCILCDNKYKGAQIRSKAKWIVEGEKNTSYFLGLESKHQTSNVIKEVLSNDGKCVKSDDEILGEMCLFYETLYSSNHVCDDNIDTYLDSVNGICNLRNDEKDMCDLFPSIQECKNAVMDMKHNKSPGLDGIPNEFYQTFWNDLDTLFYDCMREVFENEEMSFS